MGEAKRRGTPEERKAGAPARDPRLDGMELRFDGRTLRAQLLIPARPRWADDREASAAFTMRMKDAARGPRLDMVIVKGADYGDRGLLVELMVNTDAPREVLEERLVTAIEHEDLVKGTEAALLLDELEPEGAAKWWAGMIAKAHEQSADDLKRRS